MNGNIILVSLGGRNAADVIGGSKSCELSYGCDVIEVTSVDSQTAKSFIAGRSEWTVTLSYLVTDVTAHTLSVGTEYTLYFGQRNGGAIGTTFLKGKAILKSVKITATRGHLIQGSIVFQGSGPLTDDDNE